MKQHKDLEELLYNSPIRKARRFKIAFIVFVVVLTFILCFNAYMAHSAQAFKAKAIEQMRIGMINSTHQTDRDIEFFRKLKELNDNYTNNK